MQPEKMADVLGELMARRGYARVQAATNYEAAWLAAVGTSWAAQTRVGQLRRGVLEALVENNVLLQEMTFKKRELIRRLNAELPDNPVRDLRLKIGTIAQI